MTWIAQFRRISVLERTRILAKIRLLVWFHQLSCRLHVTESAWRICPLFCCSSSKQNNKYRLTMTAGLIIVALFPLAVRRCGANGAKFLCAVLSQHTGRFYFGSSSAWTWLNLQGNINWCGRIVMYLKMQSISSVIIQHKTCNISPDLCSVTQNTHTLWIQCVLPDIDSLWVF